MRKYLYLLLLVFLLCVPTVYAQWMLEADSTGGEIAFCASFTDPASSICEDSEGTNTHETGGTDWTKAIGGGGDWDTIDVPAVNSLYEVAHTNVWGCTNIGTYALQMYCINEEHNNVRYTFPSTQTHVYAELCLDLTATSGNLESGDKVQILEFAESTGPTRLVSLNVYYDGIDYRIGWEYWNQTYGGTNSSGGVFNEDQPICVSLEFEENNLIEIKLDADQNGVYESTLLSAGGGLMADNMEVKHVYFGSRDDAYLSAGESMTIELDLLGVQTTGFEGVCIP